MNLRADHIYRTFLRLTRRLSNSQIMMLLAVVVGVLAGLDIILGPPSVADAFNGLRDAVNNGDITILYEFLFFDDNNISITKIGLHAITLDTKGEQLAVFDKAGVDIYVLFDIFNGFDGYAGRNGSK